MTSITSASALTAGTTSGSSVSSALVGTANTSETDSLVSFSCHTKDKATKAKVHLENYYSNLINQFQERRQRAARLEDSLRDESISEEQRVEKRSQHAVRETGKDIGALFITLHFGRVV
jgi:hypothetical protein